MAVDAVLPQLVLPSQRVNSLRAHGHRSFPVSFQLLVEDVEAGCNPFLVVVPVFFGRLDASFFGLLDVCKVVHTVFGVQFRFGDGSVSDFLQILLVQTIRTRYRLIPHTILLLKYFLEAGRPIFPFLFVDFSSRAHLLVDFLEAFLLRFKFGLKGTDCLLSLFFE